MKHHQIMTGPDRGVTQAWHGEHDGLIWYPAHWLHPQRHGNRDVLLANARSTGFVGCIGVHKGSRRLAWLEYMPAIVEHVLLCPWRRREASDTASEREPTSFALLPGYNPAEWQDLPEPRVVRMPAPTPAYVPPVVEDFSEPEGWPHPGLVLGCATPPACVEEVEARILRALRTEFAQPRVGVAQRAYASDADWRGLHSLMRRHQIAQGESDNNEMQAALSVTSPTRRDQGDWLYALGWLRALDGTERKIVRMRGNNPSFSYRQIEHIIKIPEGTVRRVYRRSMQTMLKHALSSAPSAADQYPARAGASRRERS